MGPTDSFTPGLAWLSVQPAWLAPRTTRTFGAAREAPRGFAAPVAHCGGRMKLRALVRDRESIERFLRHQNLWNEPLGLAETRPPPYFRSITRHKPTRQAELFE